MNGNNTTMIKICAFCLSNNRKLSVIDKKYWKIVDSCFTLQDGKLQYIKCLQNKDALQLCWECSARVKNWHQFMSTSQQSIQVLNAYLETPTQKLPVTVSKLYRTHIQIIDTVPKYEETEDVTDTLDTGPKLAKTEKEDEDTGTSDEETFDVKLENVEVPEYSQTPYENIIKLEPSPPSDDEYIINLVEPAGDDVSDNNFVTKEIVIKELPVELPIETGLKKATEENTTSKRKRKGKPLPEPKCTVQWVSNEQAQAWYTSEREQERAESPTLTYLCDKCQRGFPSEQDLQTHVEFHHSETAGNHMCKMCQYRFVDQGLLIQHIESHYILYKCNKCSYETRAINSMQTHSNTEHVDEEDQRRNQEKEIKARTCTRCKNEFPSPRAMRAHKTKCTTYKCPECDATYKTWSGYHYHVARHKPDFKRKVKDGVMYCETCDVQFKDPSFYKRHIEVSLRHVSRDDYKFQCEHCNLKYPSKHRLMFHISAVHLKKGRYQCEVCPKSFMKRVGLKRHLAKQHHLGEDEGLNKTCDTCGKTFYNMRLLEDHIRTHTGERPYKCEFCPSTFAQAGSLYKHSLLQHRKRISVSKVKISKGESFKDIAPDAATKSPAEYMKEYQRKRKLKNRDPYQCEICLKSYMIRTSYHRHLFKEHNLGKDEDFNTTCSTCGKTFSNMRLLEDHVRIHTGEKPYKCEFCPSTFAQAGTLYRHGLQKHKKKISVSKRKISKGETSEDIGPEKSVCEECGKDFTFAYQLKDHINAVHKGRTDHVCKYCKKIFNSRLGLSQHNKNEHGLKSKRTTNKSASPVQSTEPLQANQTETFEADKEGPSPNQ